MQNSKFMEVQLLHVASAVNKKLFAAKMDLNHPDSTHTISLTETPVRFSNSYRGHSALNIGETSSSSINDFRWEKKPSERVHHTVRFWAGSVPAVVCFLALAAIAAFGILDNKETTYTEKNRTTNFNEKFTVCSREENVTYPIFLYLCLGLLGILIGVFVDRLCLVFEELHQLKTRYKRNFRKLVISCYSGISWKAVSFLTLIIAACGILGRKTTLRLVHVIYIVLGICICPLLIRLLNLATQSDVTVSRILEKQKMYPGYILAWSYYFNTLKKEMDNFNNLLKTHKLAKLSLARMILLTIPGTDIKSIEDLIAHDNMIELSDTDSDDNNRFPIYKLQQKENEPKYFAMACVREPLVALKKMRDTPNVPFVTDTTFDDELKRFYKTLSEILEDAPDDEYTKKGFLVPVTVKSGRYDKLNKGGLVRIIMNNKDVLAALNNDCIE